MVYPVIAAPPVFAGAVHVNDMVFAAWLGVAVTLVGAPGATGSGSIVAMAAALAALLPTLFIAMTVNE